MDHDKLPVEDPPQVGDDQQSAHRGRHGDCSPSRPDVRPLHGGENDRRALQNSYVGPDLPPNFDLEGVVS